MGEKRQRAHKNAVDDPITVRYMFEHVDGYQIGERHSACEDVRPAFFRRSGTGLRAARERGEPFDGRGGLTQPWDEVCPPGLQYHLRKPLHAVSADCDCELVL